MRDKAAAWLRQNERIVVPAWIKLVRSRGGDRDRELTTKELERQFFSGFYHAFTVAVQEDDPGRLLPVTDRIAASRVQDEYQLDDTLDIFALLKELLWTELAQSSTADEAAGVMRVLDAMFDHCLRLLMGAHTRASRDQLSARVSEAEFMMRRLAISTEETDRAMSRLRILYNISRAISSTLDLKQVLAAVAENLVTMPQIDRCAIWLADEEIYELSVILARGIDSERLQRAYLPVSEERSAVTRAFKTGKLQALPAADTGDEILAPLFPQRALLVVPLEGEDRPLGVITVDSLARNQPLEMAVIETVQSVADQTTVALRNTRLYERLVRFNQELEQRVEERTRELADLNQELARLDKKKSDFITIAAHELKTPLTLIQGYAEMLTDGGTQELNAQSLDSVVSGIIKGTGRLRALIEDIIDVALIDTEVLMLNLEPTLLSNVVEMACADLLPATQGRKQTIQMHDLAGVPPIEADALRLHQVFVNLIGNAVKYTPDGGSIDITARLLTVTGEQPVGVEVIVSDTGVGINIEDQNRIFDKFYRTEGPELHSTSKTRFMGGGPGLGLAIAKGIVDAHGGRIYVESKGYNAETCPGSHFHVLLPIRPTWGEFQASASPGQASGGNDDAGRVLKSEPALKHDTQRGAQL
ncbi:MAG: GAF domain-containing protein [Anaerolineae bacterium]|nr:GAF domain-containing protein [Anaerolineae bacterium]